MSALELARLDERQMALLERKARAYAKVPGLKEQLQGNAEAILGIMLSLAAYQLPVSLPNINGVFDWILGQAVPSARFYQALAYRAGYDLEPVEESPQRTVIRMTGPDGRSTDFAYTVEEAAASGRLDEWVEDWSKDSSGRSHKTTWVISRNGQPYGAAEMPEWAKRQVERGAIKRYEAWWAYRRDMMWKACAVRAIRKKAPHVLLGADIEVEAEPRFLRRTDVVDVQSVGPDQPAPPPGASGEVTPSEPVATPPPAGRRLSDSGAPAGGPDEERPF